MKKIYLFYLLIFILISSSCASLKVKTTTPYRSSQVKKIAIIGSYFGRVKQPKLPLIDASAFNKRTNKIAVEVMSHQKSILPEIENRLVESLGKSLKADIIKPSEFTAEQIDMLNEKFAFRGNLGIDHEHYNVLYTTSEDINLFPFDNGEVLKYFELSSNYVRNVRDICEILQVDGVAVNYNRLNVVGVGPFGISGTIRLDTHVWIYDTKGKTIGKSEAYTKPMSIKGKEMKDYKLIYEQYPVIVDLLSADIINPKSNK